MDGFANWYKIQAQEERDHAMLMMQYLQNNGEKVTLEAIAKPDKVLDDKLHVLIYMVQESIVDDCIIDRSTHYNPHDGTDATVGIVQG